jgi:hypothetical protein
LRHLGRLDLFLDLFDVRAFFAFTQFLLDRFHLLIEVEVALVFLHLAFDAAADFLVDVEDVYFALELLIEVFEPRLDVVQIQDHLLRIKLERQVCGNRVGQASGIVDAGDRREDFGRDFLVEFDVVVKLLHHGAAQCFNFAGLVACNHDSRFNRCDIGREMLLALFNLVDGGALLPFHQHLHGAVRQLEKLQDSGHATHFKHVLNRRLVFGCGFLRHQHDAALGFHGRLQRLDALGAAHEQRDHHVRKDHHVPQRQERKVNGGGRQ